jgi:hypothetical protein
VAVVVVAYRSAGDLPGCLASIRAASADDAELLVVDNDSPDDTAAAVRDDPGVTLVAMGRNAGFAAACNAGVAAASAEYVCFVNPDARPAPGSIDALVAAARRAPRHALYSGKVVTPAGSVDAGCCLALPSLWEYVCFATGLSTAFPRSRWFDPAALGGWDRGDERPVPAVSGAFLLVRRSDFLALGGFDERFFMYSEDVDLSARAGAAGRGPLFVPAAVAVHASGGSSTSGPKTVMVLRGKATYLLLHWRGGRRRAALGLLVAGAGLRAAASRVTGRGSKWRDAWAARRVWRAGW